MNQYCNKLDINFKIDADLSIYKNDADKNHAVVPNEIMGQELIDWLKTFGLELEWVEIFYLRNNSHRIHCDSAFMDVGFGKINYITGGKNSVMTWYEPIGEETGSIMKTKAGTIFRGIDPKELREVYSEHIEGFYLVSVSEFHTVWNKDDDRYCLSAYIKDSKTNTRLTITELRQKLKDYIV